MDNLWSEDIGKLDDEVEPPVSILRAQAELLGQRTWRKVEAVVEADVEYGYNYETDESFIVHRDKFAYNFYLTSLSIPGYRYKLFSISYDVSFYPVSFYLDSDVADEINHSDRALEANSEKQFLGVLKEIFNSEKTIQVIRAILSQLKH